MLELSPFKCLSPRSVFNKYISEYVNCSCGHCSACLNRKAKQYISRIESTRSFSPVCLFVTLTYSPSCLPTFTIKDNQLVGTYVKRQVFKYNQYYRNKFSNYEKSNIYATEILCDDCSNLVNHFSESEKVMFAKGGQTTSGSPLSPYTHGYCRKADVQKFFKRLRSRLEYFNHIYHDFDPCNIQYFLSSEYGPRTFRPHYHAVIFADNIQYSDILKNLISECWRYGNVDVQYIKQNAASYVAKYINGVQSLPSYLKTRETAPFHLQSSRPSLSLPFGQIANQETTLEKTRTTIVRAVNKRVFYDGRSYRVVPLSSSFISKYFPKLTGFSYSTFESLYVRYRQASKSSIKCEVRSLNGSSIQEVPVEDLCRLSRTPVSPDHPDLMMIDSSVYSDYLASRRVLRSCLIFRIPYYRYVKSIWNFYNGFESFLNSRSNCIDQLASQYEFQQDGFSDPSDLFCNLCSYSDLYHTFLTCRHWRDLSPYYRQMFKLQGIDNILYPDHDVLGFNPRDFSLYRSFQEFKRNTKDVYDKSLLSKSVNDLYKFTNV